MDTNNNSNRHESKNPTSNIRHPASNHHDDKWILEELNKLIEATTKNLENYRFSQAAEELYDFVWHTFADKYVESSKNRREEAQPILEHVLKTSLQLLHPFMPFITEELWQKLKGVGSAEEKEDLIVAYWPKSS